MKSRPKPRPLALPTPPEPERRHIQERATVNQLHRYVPPPRKPGKKKS